MQTDPKTGLPLFDCTETKDGWMFLCPHCKRPHHHGKGEGHRVAHCTDGPFRERGYVLRLSRVGR